MGGIARVGGSLPFTFKRLLYTIHRLLLSFVASFAPSSWSSSSSRSRETCVRGYQGAGQPGSMSASNSGSGDSMEWGRGRSSSGSRKGKRGGGGGSDKPRQPQRGLGVAQLEKIRIQSEMAEYLHHPLGHPPPPIHRTGSFNLVTIIPFSIIWFFCNRHGY